LLSLSVCALPRPGVADGLGGVELLEVGLEAGGEIGEGECLFSV